MDTELPPGRDWCKPDLSAMLWEFTAEHRQQAPAEALDVRRKVLAYDNSKTLGGPELSALVLAMGRLQKALGLEALPWRMTEMAWFFLTF